MNRRSFLVLAGGALSMPIAGCLGSSGGENECPNTDTDLPYTPACADSIGSFWGYLVAQPPETESVTAAGDDRVQASTVLQQIIEEATTTPDEDLGGVVTDDDVVYRRVAILSSETSADERETAAETLQNRPAGEHPDLGAGWYLDHPEQPLFITYGATILPD